MPGDVREGLGEDADDLLVDRADDASELAAGATDVLELLGEEPVPLLQRRQLLQRQRVDRTHQAELAVELPHPRLGRDTGRQLGAGRGDRLVGLAFELPAQRFDGGLQAELGLGPLELDPLEQLAGARRGRVRRRRARRAAGVGGWRSWRPRARAPPARYGGGRRAAASTPPRRPSSPARRPSARAAASRPSRLAAASDLARSSPARRRSTSSRRGREQRRAVPRARRARIPSSAPSAASERARSSRAVAALGPPPRRLRAPRARRLRLSRARLRAATSSASVAARRPKAASWAAATSLARRQARRGAAPTGPGSTCAWARARRRRCRSAGRLRRSPSGRRRAPHGPLLLRPPPSVRVAARSRRRAGLFRGRLSSRPSVLPRCRQPRAERRSPSVVTIV